VTAKQLICLLGTASLCGCSPPTYDIIAQGTAEAVVFTARDSSGTMQYVEATSIVVSMGDQQIWAINAQNAGDCLNTGHAAHPFPLRYGAVPHCWVQSVAPLPLREGVLYTVAGAAGSRRGGGDFRIDGLRVTFIDTFGNW
jgi:hypothetical protein